MVISHLFIVVILGFFLLFVSGGLLPFGVQIRAFSGLAGLELGRIFLDLLALPFGKGQGLGLVVLFTGWSK